MVAFRGCENRERGGGAYRWSAIHPTVSSNEARAGVPDVIPRDLGREGQARSLGLVKGDACTRGDDFGHLIARTAGAVIGDPQGVRAQERHTRGREGPADVSGNINRGELGRELDDLRSILEETRDRASGGVPRARERESLTLRFRSPKSAADAKDRAA